MKRNQIYYNKRTDTAFRIRSVFGDSAWCVEVKTNCGRAKMNAREFPVSEKTILSELKDGILFEVYPETLTRDIQMARAGLTPTKPKTTKHRAKTFTFKVGSLIDENPSDYVAICNQQGEVIGHEYNGRQFHKQEDEVPEKPETPNPNQLSIF